MGLCNIYEYQRLKSIKLSDSYGVQIRINEEDKEPLILYECTSVTLPTIKMKTDVIQYGNNAKMFVYPDYSNIGELELEFLEHYSKENVLCIQNFVNTCLNKLFNDHTFTYILNDYIHELIIKVYSNNFDYCSIEHVFHHLKLSDYTKYDLDYSSSEIAKWTLKFMFMEYFVRRPYEVEAVSDPGESAPSETVDEIDVVKVAEEAGAAAAAARQQQLSRGRGVETPAQNLEMAEARLVNLQKEQAAKGTITQEEKAELSAIEKRKALLTSELEKIEQQEAAINGAVAEEEKKKTEIRDPNKDPTGALSDVVKRTAEELHIEEASKAMSSEVKELIDNSGLEEKSTAMSSGVKDLIDNSGLQENSMALANMVGDMSVAIGRVLGIKKDEVTDVAAPELTAAPEYTPPRMTKADIIAELNELNEYEAEIKQNIANRELNNRKEVAVIRDQISRFENDNNRNRAIDPVDLHDRTTAMEEAAVALERVNWTTERKDFESKNKTDLTSEYDAALDSDMDRKPLSPDYLELLNEDFDLMEDMDQMSTKDILHDTIGLSDTTKSIISDSDDNQDQNEEQNEEQVPMAVTRKRVLLDYSKDQYGLIKSQMSVNDILNATSNNNSGAYAITATSLFIGNESRLLDNDNVYGKDVVSQKTINKINATNKATAENVEFNPTSVDDLKKGLEKFSNENDDALYVISVDPSKISGLTKWGLKKIGGDYVEKILTEGYAVTIHKGNVGEGVGNINRQKDDWLAEFSKYEFFANRVLNSGDLQFKVMKVTTK